MTQQLGKYLARALGTAAYRSHDADWRHVPKINLLASGRRVSNRTLIIGAAVVFLIEAILLLFFYADLTSVRDDTEAERRLLQSQELLLAAEEQDVQELHRELGQFQPGETIAQTGAYGELTAAHISWGAAISRLFQSEVPGVTFQSIVATPESGSTEVFGTAGEVRDMVRFQSEIQGASGILELLSLRWQEGDASLEFSAAFSVRQAANSE